MTITTKCVIPITSVPHRLHHFLGCVCKVPQLKPTTIATHTTFYGSLDFVQDNPGEPVPEETFTYSHLLWSSIIPYCIIHLLWSVASSLFNLRAWQSFSAISKFSLAYLLAWHPPLTTYISSPNHCFLFAAHAHTIATWFAVVPRLCHLILVSLSTLYLELYIVA